jgi:hypothetical protein
VLAVGLESVADVLRPLPEYLEAFGTFDFDFFVDHERPCDTAILRPAT